MKNIAATNALTVAKKALVSISGIVASALLSMAVTSLISFFADLIDKMHKTKEEAKKLIEEAETELESIESELEDISAKIDELNSKDSLSITDKEDLERLKEENKELKIRQKYLEMQKQENEKEVSDKSKYEHNIKYGKTSREDVDKYKDDLINSEKNKVYYGSSYLNLGYSDGDNSYAAGYNPYSQEEEVNNLAKLTSLWRRT